jgi:predicted amidophosphoribosyltransferase
VSATTWPVVTCAACGKTGPGRPKIGLCKRCYARTSHQTRLCAGCGQNRRHLAVGLCARCYRLSRTRLAICPGCGEPRPVYFGDRCERCKRRAAARAGACQDCGKEVARLWSGRCRSCDQKSGEATGACADCGELTSLTSGLCKACRHFRWRHPAGTCPVCWREQPIGSAGACRPCQAAHRAAGRKHKQQRTRVRARPVLSPAGWQLLEILTDYGQARGWTESTLLRARRSLTAVLASGEDLGQPPWDAAELRRFLNERHLIALRALEFLADQDLVRGTQDAVLQHWVAGQLAGLPDPIAAEVRIWTDALQGRGPRPARPRKPTTIQGYVRILQAPLAGWARRYGSLRQVTTEDLSADLAPLTGATRLLTLSAMRSLLGTLKARRVLFTNPAAPLTGRALQPPPVLALDPARRASLLGRLRGPDERLTVLLAGVHALLPSQIRMIAMDDADPATSTLLAGGRTRPLDQLTAQHLRAWLEARRARWPTTANPYLLINRSTAGGLKPVSRGYIQDTVRRAGITAQELRADRLLGEAQASGGDPLKLTRLFGISDPTAIRYCAENTPPGHARATR